MEERIFDVDSKAISNPFSNSLRRGDCDTKTTWYFFILSASIMQAGYLYNKGNTPLVHTNNQLA